ncbi:unnamed protein product [Ambrosiozyma monospora]|uniref:Unnamed protein product n=1 Tax=Ambrosiozyma monospora TaxID=43982 RepID=A0ACB5TWJ7_AMBMO|nr:unnamed protein product [Ambrosiozyma monospora]
MEHESEISASGSRGSNGDVESFDCQADDEFDVGEFDEFDASSGSIDNYENLVVSNEHIHTQSQSHANSSVDKSVVKAGASENVLKSGKKVIAGGAGSGSPTKLWTKMTKALSNFSTGNLTADAIDDEPELERDINIDSTLVESNSGAPTASNSISGLQGVDDQDEEVVLPSYDDLYPSTSTTGSSAASAIRALINFRGHQDDDTTKSKKSKSATTTTPTATETIDPAAEDSDSSITSVTSGSSTSSSSEIIVSLKSQMSWTSDTRLLFFWLPFMLILILILLGTQFEFFSWEKLEMLQRYVDLGRDKLCSVLLGQERFVGLLDGLAGGIAGGVGGGENMNVPVGQDAGVV